MTGCSDFWPRMLTDRNRDIWEHKFYRGLVSGFVKLDHGKTPTLRDYLSLGYIPKHHGSSYFGVYVKGVETKTSQCKDLGYVGGSSGLG